LSSSDTLLAYHNFAEPSLLILFAIKAYSHAMMFQNGVVAVSTEGSGWPRSLNRT
jgi:hypothetical protein